MIRIEDEPGLVARMCKDMEPLEGFRMNDRIQAGVTTTALISIAVSLKRIADSVQKLESTND